MRIKTSKLRDAIALSIVAGAAFGGTAFAQQQQPQQQQQSQPTRSELDRITVTGTRIKSQTMTAASPVTEISAEEFKFAGATIVEDLVNQYPQMSPIFDNFQNNPSTGYSQVDLRGIGANRTLTLVNGRRIPKGLAETADISIIPSALVQRVDILTGGASAVYGSDAIAGVVNFILDDRFEGINLNVGWSAYQHNNDNAYMQGKMDAKGFDYPTGGSGFDGVSRNADLAIGGAFGEGGHAVAWATWRKNESLFQGQRDYSSCALNAAGTACGGSNTADPANFYVYNGVDDFVLRNGGRWAVTSEPHLYNYAPINYYQRPDSRFTAGTSIKYEINQHFQPYLDVMFMNRRAPVQIAPSGAFFTDVVTTCNYAPLGTFCADLGIAPTEQVHIQVAKRNTEGGPRYYDQEYTNYSMAAGVTGAITDNWSYDASFVLGRTTTSYTGFNDFLTSRIQSALLGCPAGSFSGCIPYTVWDNSQTPAQAQALQGVSQQDWVTTLRVLNAYVTGSLGAIPSADNEPISLVAGYESRNETYSYVADSAFSNGDFAGSGSTNPQISNGFSLREFFAEANIPLITDMGALSRMNAEVGYRFTDYSFSGGVNTYKIGLGASFMDDRYKLRAGFNRAIRGASINELFAPQALGLWGGTDPCAGATPEYSAAECALTGVPAGRYGRVPANSASQYNQMIGNNPMIAAGSANPLAPEEASTWTLGFAATPIENLDVSLDYYDIKLQKQIGGLGARVTIDLCAKTGDPVACSRIHRNPTTGGLRSPTDFVENYTANNGDIRLRGLDLSLAYRMTLGPGRLSTSFVGNYELEREYAPRPGFALSTYNCAGVISPECQSPQWRHIANVRYSFDRYTIGLRWRYIGEMDYKSPYNGNALISDRLMCAAGTPVPNNANGTPGDPCLGTGKLGAFNYFDLSGSVELGGFATLTVGVNNVIDKEPPITGAGLALNGNSPGGYDQAGRYFFTSVNFKF